MDIFFVIVWRDLRLRNFETTFQSGSDFSWRGLFRAQRKQRLSISCYISRKSRFALCLRFSCRISAWVAESSSQRRYRQIIHFHHLLRLLWFELFSTAEEILHFKVEARVSRWRGCCVHDPVFACGQECRSDSKEEDQGANLFLRWRYSSTGDQRVCSGIALGLAHFLRSE